MLTLPCIFIVWKSVSFVAHQFREYVAFQGNLSNPSRSGHLAGAGWNRVCQSYMQHSNKAAASGDRGGGDTSESMHTGPLLLFICCGVSSLTRCVGKRGKQFCRPTESFGRSRACSIQSKYQQHIVPSVWEGKWCCVRVSVRASAPADWCF